MPFRVLCAGNPVKYASIGKHKAQWPITLSCEVLEVCTSGYFEHWQRKMTNTLIKPVASRRVAMDKRHHLHCHRRGLVVFDGGA